MNRFILRIKANILENHLINSGERILISFSGGPDSTALLYCLNKLRDEFKIELTACYINHNIRPEAVKNEIKFCSNFCNKLKIPFILVDVDIPEYARAKKLSLEEAGRYFRQTVLPKIAVDEACGKIAQGLHQDDIIETILFRLFRGTGPGGLSPIKPISGKFIRPLYNISKAEIVTFLKRNRIKYLIDRSNLKSEFSRNYIRNKIIPVIKRQFGPKFANSISRFAMIIADENSYLRRHAERQLKKICTVSPAGKIVLDLKKFLIYDIAEKRVMVKLLLENLYNFPGAGSFEQIEKVMTLTENRLRAVDLSKSRQAVRDRDSLIFFNKGFHPGKAAVHIPGTVELPEIKSAVRTEIIPLKAAVFGKQKGGFIVNVDAENIKPPLWVSGIKPGDKFRPLGLNGTKKVGDYLTDKKIHRCLRDEIPVVRDKNEIVWLVGHEISDCFKINNKTKKVLKIELIKRKSKK